MTTTVTSSIGTGGTYTTAQAWEDACPADLTAVDQIWRGEVKNETLSGATTIAGTTTDATRYLELTTQAGASFIDNIGSGALRYDTSYGAVLFTSGGYISAITNQVDYTRISKLQLVSSLASSTAFGSAQRCTVDRCIMAAAGTGAGGALNVSIAAGTAKFTNCLVYNDVSSAGCIVRAGGGFEAYNCTFIVPSGRTAATYAFDGSYGACTIQNCAIFGATTVDEHANSTFTYTTCFTDSASPPTGVTQVAFDTSTGSGFAGITAGTLDARIKSTSALRNAGTTDATNAPTDIFGTARPQSALYDVGCFELVATSGIPVLSAAAAASLTATAATPQVTLAF